MVQTRAATPLSANLRTASTSSLSRGGWLIVIGLILGCSKAEEGVDPRLVWNNDQLHTVPVDFKATEVNSNLLGGQAATIDGLETQRLDFVLPSRNLRLWRADGRVLYACGAQELARIDTQNWRMTHKIDLPYPLDAMKGVALTSEGLVVAIRDVKVVGNERVRQIDPRTGKDFETTSVRQLILLDPATLQLKKVFIGPAALLAGSPQSPVVCVSDDRVNAKLIDLRSGKVLAVAGENVKSPGSQAITGFEDILMSPDGKVLYHRDSIANVIARTDISAGKFVELAPHEPAESPADATVLEALTMFLSSDGNLLAVRTGDQYEGGYSFIQTDPQSESETRSPVAAPGTTDFSFVGKENRPVYNGRQQGGNQRAFDLILSARQEYQLHSDTAVAGDRFSTQHSTLCGSPASELVLVSNGMNSTLLVRLPPDTASGGAETGLAIQPLEIRGNAPDDPLKFAKAPPKDRFEEVLFPSVPAPESASIACSYDGTRLYLLGSDGTLHMFDTESLQEIRRGKVNKRDDGAFHLWMTRFGPLVKEQSEPWYQLFDGTTLDGLHQFRLDDDGLDREIAVSPNSFALGFATRTGDVEIRDIRNGRLVKRVNQRQLADLEPPEATPPSSGPPGARSVAISDDGTVLMCRYYSWHAFRLSDDEVAPLATLKQDPESQPQSRPVAIPLPEAGLCYIADMGFLKAFDFPKFAGPGRFVEVPQAQAISRQGLIYARQPGNAQNEYSTELQVFGPDGNELMRGRAFNEKWQANILPLPHRPERVFVLENLRLHVADLDGRADEP